MKKRGLIDIVIKLGIVAVIVLFIREFSGGRVPLPVPSSPKPGCNIKGNISLSKGNKVYHVPGMEDYESTVIDLTKGERWFCTESEAIANGWRKAPR